MVDHADNPPQTVASPVKKKPRIVGDFIRTRREQLNLSQKALGALFNPPVTTQFISNVERGVTPLPPVHIQTLCQALQVTEEDFKLVLESEYVAKLTGKLHEGQIATLSNEDRNLTGIKKAYLAAGPETKKSFIQFCRDLFKIDLLD